MKILIGKQKVLSLDQALQQSGYAISDKNGNLLETGIITPDTKDQGDYRFVTVRKKFQELIDYSNPSIIVMEPPYGDDLKDERGIKTFSVLHGIMWMIKELAAEKDIKVIEIPAAMWQNRVGIFKRDRASRKLGAKDFAIKQYNLSEDLPQDIYDACCILYTYFYNKEFTPGETSWIKEEKKETMAEREKRSAF